MKHRASITSRRGPGAQPKMFSLKRQIVAATWFFVIVIGLLLVTFLISTVNSYQKKADERRTGDLASYAETLETNLAALRDATGEIYSNNSAFDGLNVYPSPGEKLDYVYELLNLLRVQIKSNQGIAGLCFYYDSFDRVQYVMNEQISFSIREELKKAGRIALKGADKVYSDFFTAEGENVWYSIYMKKSSAAIGGCISLNQGLPDEKEGTATYGILSEGRLYVTWQDPSSGETASFSTSLPGNLEPGKTRVDGWVVYVRQMNSGDLAVVEILPEGIWLYVNKIHLLWLILIILYFIAAFRLERFVYEELFRPLTDMTTALENIRSGEWEVQFSAPNRISEIEDVRHSVKALLSEVEQYKIRFYEEELAKEKIQRQYLQLQLAPHFYTNCLKNAYYMLALKEYDNAKMFLKRLSVHLRYLLQKDKPLVRVGQEIDFVNNYVDMQKLMTSKSLSCRILADEETLGKEIPILGIQTFVENSVKYARDSGESQLLIEVSVKYRRTEEGNFLDITVEDNGHGYQQELLDVINEAAPAEKEGMAWGLLTC